MTDSTVVGTLPTTSRHLVALSHSEMQHEHGRMLAWAIQTKGETAAELEVQAGNLETAKHRKWNPAPFQRLVQMLRRRVTFYGKIEAALRAGFVLVPNFDMTAFAIRVDRDAPNNAARSGRWNNFAQPAQLLAAGDGRYVSPDPNVLESVDTVSDGKGGTKEDVYQWADAFQDVAFPMAIARPELVTRTGEVLALKLFDEVGLAVDTRRRGRGDPILLGHFANPRRGRPGATFFLGWYFDPSAL